MPTFTSFSSILLVMAALSKENPAINTPFLREDTGLVDIVMLEDEGFKFEEINEEETTDETFDIEDKDSQSDKDFDVEDKDSRHDELIKK